MLYDDGVFLTNKIVFTHTSRILVENLLHIASRIYFQEVALGTQPSDFPFTFVFCPFCKMLSIRYF